MSDYLGPNQTRVLDSTNRSFESITYQKRKPPLSSEVNLTGKVDAQRSQNMINYMIPSGWAYVGQIKDNVSENTAQMGDILCSPNYTKNTFKIMGLNLGENILKNIAWVNGQRVLIQGSGSSDENNIVTLPEPPTIGTRVDFVFLEVWRKLIYPSDVVYKYGNVLYGGTNFTNDLIDPAMGIETSLRIQVQYRIRVASSDIESYSDGFDPNQVFVQGPLAEPISTCSHSYYSPVAKDIGLWYAGSGDSVSQETLNTVDGFVYAIPICAVRRRNTSSYDPDNRSNGAGRTLSDYWAGLPSDRPDDYYNDWVVADDILDMRSRVSPGENLKEVCEDAFKRLVNNKLYSKMTKSSLGEDHFGIKLLVGDAVSNVDKGGTTRIAQGDGVRRIFSNAEMYQSDAFVLRTIAQKTYGTPNIAWAVDDAVQISLSSYPSDTNVVSIDEIYTTEHGAIGLSNFAISTLPGNVVTIAVRAGNTVVGSTIPLTIEYTIHYTIGPNGLTSVPTTFLEARQEDSSASIAMPNLDINVRDSSAVGTSDGTMYDTLMNRGGGITDLWDFGHQMTYHQRGNGTQIITCPRSLYGYNVLGIASVNVSGVLRTNPDITRDSTGYVIDVGSPSVELGKDVELTLYTENKFFEGNKQGRAITECYEMTELTPDETADGGRVIFHVDSQTRPILALGSYEGDDGAGFAYVNGSRKVLETTNREYPYDSTKNYGTVEFSLVDTPPSGATIEVPMLLHSAIGSAEGYSFFYESVPYQGLLDSSATGMVEAVGSAIVTTAGSGCVTDYTYAEGTALFTDTTTVYGTGTEWLSNVKIGNVISADADSSKEYRIVDIYDDVTLFINVEPDRTSVSTESYVITGKDMSYFNHTNIIDRFPTYEADNDASGCSGQIATAITDGYPTLETRIISRVQDIADMPPNSFWIGENVADRGRSTIGLSSNEAPLGLGNLGLKFEKLTSSGKYKKVYQSYIFNDANTGRLYLMVAGSETDNTSASNYFNHTSNMDVIDTFELPGRPIIMKRIA